eukprot:scaffold677146_cov62-Prasinocladus_malaysianus.AAC.1
MPLFVHCREAAEEVLHALKSTPPVAPVVIHCFTGSKDELKRFIDLGCYIGVTGWVCDDRPERGSDVLR